MKKLWLLLLAGCASASSATNSSSDEIRPLLPEEVLGEIRYGETLDVDVAALPRYRALSFHGEQFDAVQAQVISLDATDPVMWILDDAFNIIASNNDTRATDLNASISSKFLPKTGTYYLVFREMNGAPKAKFSVAVRKIGALPPECDPEGEGFVNPDCTEPPDMDPFDPASCAGAPLADPAGLFGPGLSLSGSKIYYRTRQCSADGCSPWVRAFSMDVKLAKIAAAAPESVTPYVITGDASRKVAVALSVNPPASPRYCVDGPFVGVRGNAWGPLADGSRGVCGVPVSTIVTGTCVRIEPPPIELASGDPAYYTEFSSVLLAKY